MTQSDDAFMLFCVQGKNPVLVKTPATLQNAKERARTLYDLPETSLIGFSTFAFGTGDQIQLTIDSWDLFIALKPSSGFLRGEINIVEKNPVGEKKPVVEKTPAKPERNERGFTEEELGRIAALLLLWAVFTVFLLGYIVVLHL